MEDNQYNSMDNNESIFSNLAEQQSKAQASFQNVPVQESSLINKFIDSISDKYNEFKNAKFEEKAMKVFEENGPFLKLLNDFGCTVEITPTQLNLNCEALNKKGCITIKKDKSIEFDDDAQYIFEYIAHVVNRTESLEEIISKYEEQGYYPVGELTKENIAINGKECEVLVGTLENNNKEQKTIYYYKGQELFLEEQ